MALVARERAATLAEADGDDRTEVVQRHCQDQQWGEDGMLRQFIAGERRQNGGHRQPITQTAFARTLSLFRGAL